MPHDSNSGERCAPFLEQKRKSRPSFRSFGKGVLGTYHPVSWLLAEERKEVSAVVGYERKLPLADDWQQLPIFWTYKA